MKTKIIISLTIILVYLSDRTMAQTDVDALRYSGGSITGTARYTSMAGAFGALGGDFSSLSENPAGIGVYRSSEFTFSPSIYVGATNSTFLGQSTDEHKFNFNIGNVGLIFTKKLSDDENSPGWKSWNFGIGYNRLDNFHSQSFYSGKNLSNSLLDLYAQNATGVSSDNLDPYYESLAYNTYLINPDANNNYTSVIPSGQEIQRRSTETSGATGETGFTFGGNYSNKLFLGGTLGIKSLRYSESRTYEELDPDTSIPYFNSFRLQEDFTTTGTGIDVKLGMIYKVNDLFRFGFSFESPTWYTMHDDYINSMSSLLDTGSVKTHLAESPEGSFDYNFSTPLRVRGSLAFVFNKYGLISGDYEFSDYGESSFNAPGTSFSDVNNLIVQKYTAVHTVKIGTEWLLQSLSFRGGFAYSTSPLNDIYKTGSSDYSKTSFTGGIGYREDNLFFDIGYAYTFSDQYFQPYTLMSPPESVPGVKSRVVSNNFVITMGVKF